MRNSDVSGSNRAGIFLVETEENSVRSLRHSHHIPALAKLIAKARAYLIVNGIRRALREVDLIDSGHIKPKSIEQLLSVNYNG